MLESEDILLRCLVHIQLHQLVPYSPVSVLTVRDDTSIAVVRNFKSTYRSVQHVGIGVTRYLI